MTTQFDNEVLISTLPYRNRPGTDLMSKLILEDEEVKDAIIETVIGVKAVGKYWPRPTEWPNGTRSDVLYATDNSEMPPVLVEVQNVVDEKFIHRVVRYCEEIFSKYGTPPVVIVIAINDCKYSVASRATKNKKTPFFLKLQSYPWAQKCLLLSKESISPYLDKSPLDPVVALGSFFVEQKQYMNDHPYCEDTFVQLLYSRAHHIFQSQVASEDTKIGFLLRTVDDAELRYKKAIEMLQNDEENESAKKRTIRYLRESMEVLKACKRQCVASGPSTSSQTPLSSARESRCPSPANSIQEPSSQLPTTSAELSSSVDRNWQFVETYMNQIGNDKMNWQTCYTAGQHQGYFKQYSTYASLKNAYNRWKKNERKA